MTTLLPPGFELETQLPQSQPAGPALPPGFELDPGFAAAPQQQQQIDAPALPEGFELQATPGQLPAAEPQGMIDRYLVDPLIRGKNNILDQTINVGGYLSGAVSAEDFAAAIIQDMQQGAAEPRNPADQTTLDNIAAAQKQADDEFLARQKTIFDQKVQNAATPQQAAGYEIARQLAEARGTPSAVGAMAREVAQNPGAAVVVAGESAAAMPAVIAAGAAGAAAGSAVAPGPGTAVGAGLGAGAASGTTDFAVSLVGKLQEAGAEPTQENMVRALKDPQFMSEAYDYAVRRGLSVAVFDAMGFGVAGSLAGPVGRAAGGGVRGVVAGTAAETAAQAATGAGGEAAAQLASEGEISSPGEVFLEGVAEVPGSVVEIPGAVLARRVGGRAQPEAQPAAQTQTPVEIVDPATVPADITDISQPVTPPAQTVAQTPAPAAAAPQPAQQDLFADQTTDPITAPEATPAEQVAAPALPDGFEFETQAADPVADPDPAFAQAQPQAADEGQADLFEDTDFAPDSDMQLRDDPGSLTPGMNEVSFTNRRSYYEDAYKAAGIDPDVGINLPPVQQRNVLARVLDQQFGLKTNIRSDLPTVQAQNQMLDAYRNVRFMMSSLGLPEKAVSLGGTLNLSLERFRGKYLGMYNGATRTIHMPGRSNSFAHEWMHALDHHVAGLLPSVNVDNLLSRIARSDGLDVTTDLPSAFVKLLNTMAYDETELALRMLDLERKAQGTSKAAQTAQQQLDAMRAGNSRLRVKMSNFRDQSATYGALTGGPGGAQYYGSVHEMLARAFEAYVGHKVERDGGTNEFITKGDKAYLSDADERLRMTFPKDQERARIFAAFDELFDHVRDQALLGSGPAATKPDDSAKYDPQRYNNARVQQETKGKWTDDVRREFISAGNWISDPKNMFRSTVSEFAIRAGISTHTPAKQQLFDKLKAVQSHAQYWLGAQRGVLFLAVARAKGNGDQLLRYVVSKVATNPGSGQEVRAIYEAERDQKTAQLLNRLENVIETNNVKSQLINKRRLSDKDNELIREISLGRNPAGATQAHRAIAGEVRRVMTDAYLAAQKVGLEIGYVEDTGYLTRVLKTAAVEEKPAEFVRAAARVYRIQFDRLTANIDPADMLKLAKTVSKKLSTSADRPRPFAPEIKAVSKAMRAVRKAETDLKLAQLANDQKAITQARQELAQAKLDLDDAMDAVKDAIRDPFAWLAAEDWRTRIIAGNSFTYDSHGPGLGNFNKSRSLPKEADDILADFYDTDVLNLATNYVRRMTSQTEYTRLMGNSSGNTDARVVLNRKENAPRIANNRTKYNPDTEAGILAIIKDLADPKRDNLLEMALQGVGRIGGPSESIATVRAGVQNITGRGERASSLANRASNWVYVIGVLSLLPRATWSSLAEPLAAVFQTGEVKLAFKNLVRTVAELNRKSTTIAERAALARAIGLVTGTLDDTVTSNRVGGDPNLPGGESPLMNNFFRATFLTQVTNAQRRASMVTAYEWITQLAVRIEAGEKGGVSGVSGKLAARLFPGDRSLISKAQAKIARAELRDLGVPDVSMDEFIQEVLKNPDMPTDLQNLDGAFEQLRSRAVNRFVDQTITNPHRQDKPAWATSSYGRLVAALMSFLYTFTRLTYGRTYEMAKRDYKLLVDEGVGKKSAAAASLVNQSARLATGFALIMLGQMLVSIPREMIFSPEQWDDKEEKGELDSWLLRLAMSRSGVFGPADLPVNVFTGLRYERDLTSVLAGSYLGMMLTHVQNISKLVMDIRNSPNTNTVERQAAKSAYALVAAPLLSGALTAVPAPGPLSNLARYYVLTNATSNKAASRFADVTVGESNSRK